MKGLLIMQASQPERPSVRPLRVTSRARSLLFFIFIFAGTATALAQDNRTDATTAELPQPVVVEQEGKPQPTPNVPAKSIVRGRVIYEDTNRPVRRARLMLLRSDGGTVGSDKTGVTNERGEFQIKDVPAGVYILMVDAPGIITPLSSVELEEGMNERTAFASLKKEFDEIPVNGTNSVSVQIRARRGAVITGRVTYQDGDPATGAQIVILRKKEGRLTRFILSFSPATMLALRTDDRGVYRVAGLPPGEYVVGAAEANTRDDGRDEYALMGINSSNFSVSYYQNETSLKQATAVKVEAGQETNEINITLIERALYTVSGTVVARQGRTPVRAQVSIQSKSESSPLPFLDSGPSTNTDEQGHWSFTGIPDGTYVIKADPGTDETGVEIEEAMMAAREGRTVASPAPRRPSLVPRQQDVTVSGADLSGIVIDLSEGARIQGTVMVEGGDKKLPQGLGVYLVPREGRLTGLDRYGFIREDGSFTLEKVQPGEFHLTMQEMGDKFYVKSITAGGVDLMREPLRVGSGTILENVRITIATDVSVLQGRVVSSGGAGPVRGAIVLLVPADPARWRSTASYLPEVTQADGAFKFTAAPGSYLLIMLGEGENLRSVNEAFIRARSAGAKAVTLSPGGRETVELVMSSSAP